MPAAEQAPEYKYYNFIKSPSDMGMGSDGSWGTLSNDVAGLISYVKILVSGRSPASTTGGPLGNKYFLNTNQKCTGPNNESVDRYIYINNVPDGSIPFISQGINTNFSEFKGLVPGMISDMGRINPAEIFTAFTNTSTPKCQAIQMQTIDSNNNIGTETHYVATEDIKYMSPCWFPSRRNPITGESCREGFTSKGLEYEDEELNNIIIDKSKIPEDKLVRLFYYSLGGIGVYVLLCMLKRLYKKM
jgi:hypothetical protein